MNQKQIARQERISAARETIRANSYLHYPIGIRDRNGCSKRVAAKAGNGYVELVRQGRSPEQASSIVAESNRVWK